MANQHFYVFIYLFIYQLGAGAVVTGLIALGFSSVMRDNL